MVAIERGGLVNRSSRQWPTNKGKRVALVAIALLHVHHKDIETDASNFTRIKKVILRYTALPQSICQLQPILVLQAGQKLSYIN